MRTFYVNIGRVETLWRLAEEHAHKMGYKWGDKRFNVPFLEAAENCYQSSEIALCLDPGLLKISYNSVATTANRRDTEEIDIRDFLEMSNFRKWRISREVEIEIQADTLKINSYAVSKSTVKELYSALREIV